MHAVVGRPATLFIILSLVFGCLVIAANPPLRGPDEMAHFIRAYGFASGDLVPATSVEGRVGTYLPAELGEQYDYFNSAWRHFIGERFSYRGVMAAYMQRDRLPGPEDRRPPVFVLYEGTEGYTPIAYLPHIAAAFVSRLAGLDFLAMSYLMRLSGLVVMTIVIAWAIAITPSLKWVFFLVGMLPAALYGRSVIGADGGTLAFTMAVTALCLRAATANRDGDDRIWLRSGWMTLAILSKPPQVVFALLELMAARRWRRSALVVLPGLLMTPLWIFLVSGEVSAWRIIQATGLPAYQFDPIWKIGFMIENPLHFPKLLLASMGEQWRWLWVQLIGVLGWLDVELRPWVYPTLGLLLLLVPAERLGATRISRLRIGLTALLVVVAYIVCVYATFFITWTSIEANTIWGLQGRYFLVALPATAVFLAALINRGLPALLRAAVAILGALISGTATVEALLITHW